MKPPGHTCPQIDAALSAMRRMAWRARHPEHASETSIEDILRTGEAALERVREENKQMREAYWEARKRLQEIERKGGE